MSSDSTINVPAQDHDNSVATCPRASALVRTEVDRESIAASGIQQLGDVVSGCRMVARPAASRAPAPVGDAKCGTILLKTVSSPGEVAEWSKAAVC
jgi:hypothetical protein